MRARSAILAGMAAELGAELLEACGRGSKVIKPLSISSRPVSRSVWLQEFLIVTSPKNVRQGASSLMIECKASSNFWIEPHPDLGRDLAQCARTLVGRARASLEKKAKEFGKIFAAALNDSKPMLTNFLCPA